MPMDQIQVREGCLDDARASKMYKRRPTEYASGSDGSICVCHSSGSSRAISNTILCQGSHHCMYTIYMHVRVMDLEVCVIILDFKD